MSEPADYTRWWWRTGRKTGRTVYAIRPGAEPSDDDPLIGVMDTPRLASEAVAAHNALCVSRADWSPDAEIDVRGDP